MKVKKLFQFYLSIGIAAFGYSQNTVYQTSTALPGYSNTLIGVGSGFNLLGTGNGQNTFVGVNAGYNTQAEMNTFIGTGAGFSNSSGRQNTFIGAKNVGAGNTTGEGNVMIGLESGEFSTTGSNNVFVGNGAARGNGTGAYNCSIGYHSGGGISDNIAIGTGALQYGTSSENIAFGRRAGERAGGVNNITIGTESGTNITTSAFNVIVGAASGRSMLGANNAILGRNSGVNLSGNANIIVGQDSGTSYNGENNVIVGNLSGNSVTGDFNTFLGRVVIPAPNNVVSNTVILADGNGAQRLYISNNGNAGIGLGNNVIPQNRLEVKSAASNTSGLRFTNLKNTFNPALTVVATKFLTVDANGDVVLQHSKNIYTHDGDLLSNRIVSMKDKSLIFDTDNDGRIYIGNTGTLPFNTTNFPTTSGKYRLYVEGGILTEKVKVAMRNPSTNWADYVFADDYKLMPLNEIETFVKENKHLPGIESAEELVKSGLDLGEMQAKQMGKIEELTLYVIEQNKTLDKQNKEIEELKAQMKVLMEKK